MNDEELSAKLSEILQEAVAARDAAQSVITHIRELQAEMTQRETQRLKAEINKLKEAGE